MTQKAKRVPTTTDRLRQSLRKNRELYGLSRINRSPINIQTAPLGNSGSSAGGVQSSQGNFLKTSGDTMVGPIAFYPSTVSISTGSLDISFSASSTHAASTYVIASFSSPDTLTEILGAAFSGQLLYLQIPANSTLTLEDFSNNAGGNIITDNGTDMVLQSTSDAPKIVRLIFDVTQAPNGVNGGWVVATEEVDVWTKDHDANGNRLFLDADGDSQINAVTDDVVQIVTGGVARFSISNTSIISTLPFISEIDLNGNDLTVDADGDSKISASVDDEVQIVTGGSTRMKINSTSTVIFAGNLDLNNNNIIDINTITASGLAAFNGDVSLGNSATDNINISGQVASDVIPDLDSTYDLGSLSLAWQSVFTDEVGVDNQHKIQFSASQVKVVVNGTGDTFVINDGSTDRIFYDYSSDDVYPVDSVANLGGSSNRWIEIFADNVLNVSFSKFKKNIKKLRDKDCLDIVNALDTIEYEWNDDRFKNAKQAKKSQYIGKKFVGFNADALKTMLPHAVKDDMIYQNSVIGVLLGAVRDLQKQVDLLRSQQP